MGRAGTVQVRGKSSKGAVVPGAGAACAPKTAGPQWPGSIQEPAPPATCWPAPWIDGQWVTRRSTIIRMARSRQGGAGLKPAKPENERERLWGDVATNCATFGTRRCQGRAWT
jgi:hypothetical protein